ncbi:MAG: hypothetical protein GXO39_05270 [Thermotogae bacterium]|nr:hypothetical protein [Thermotogota bacterium]
MRCFLLRFSLPILLLISCIPLGRRKNRHTTSLQLPPSVLAEMEIGRIKYIYDNLPDFVAYGRYTFNFLFNRNKGTFKMFKAADTLYIKLQDGRTFIVPWDTVMNVRVENANIKFAQDSTVVVWDSRRVVLVGDLLVAYNGPNLSLKLEDYDYDPFPYPRRLMIRSMGATIILLIDSIVPLP